MNYSLKYPLTRNLALNITIAYRVVFALSAQDTACSCLSSSKVPVTILEICCFIFLINLLIFMSYGNYQLIRTHLKFLQISMV